MTECLDCNTPLEKDFTCYVIVPGDATANKNNTNGAIVKNCLECYTDTITIENVDIPVSGCGPTTEIQCDVKLKALKIVGCVQIVVGMQIEGIDSKHTRICCKECVCFDKDDDPLCICCPDCCCDLDCDCITITPTIDVDNATLVEDGVYKIPGTITVTIDCPSSCP